MRWLQPSLGVLIATGGLLVLGAQPTPDLEATPTSSRSRCRALLKSSVHHFEAGHYDSALTELGSVLDCDPANPDGFYYRARVLLVRGDTTAAISSLTQGVERAPLSSRLKLLLARIDIAQGELDEAETLVGDVLAVKPGSGEALYLKGLVHLERGDTTATLTNWQQALVGAIPEVGE